MQAQHTNIIMYSLALVLYTVVQIDVNNARLMFIGTFQCRIPINLILELELLIASLQNNCQKSAV